MTFSLGFCKRLHALLGEYETEKIWMRAPGSKEWNIRLSSALRAGLAYETVPCISFQELLRLLPHVGANKGWCELHGGDWYWFDQKDVVMHVAMLYALAPTEEEAYAQVEAYLSPLI